MFVKYKKPFFCMHWLCRESAIKLCPCPMLFWNEARPSLPCDCSFGTPFLGLLSKCITGCCALEPQTMLCGTMKAFPLPNSDLMPFVWSPPSPTPPFSVFNNYCFVSKVRLSVHIHEMWKYYMVTLHFTEGVHMVSTTYILQWTIMSAPKLREWVSLRLNPYLIE